MHLPPIAKVEEFSWEDKMFESQTVHRETYECTFVDSSRKPERHNVLDIPHRHIVNYWERVMMSIEEERHRVECTDVGCEWPGSIESTEAARRRESYESLQAMEKAGHMLEGGCDRQEEIIMVSEQVSVSLTKPQDELWKLFHSKTNEMVVRKVGKKIFPKLEYVVTGLVPDKLYAIVLHIEPVDESRYTFSNGEWAKSWKTTEHSEPQKVPHAGGVMSGKQWMLNPISFDRVKITNHSDAANASTIFVHSMHKYIPVLSIYEIPSDSPIVVPQPSTLLVSSTKLSYTEFIAVTTYQNKAVSKLKIDQNPYAMAFREKSVRKRGSLLRDDSASEESFSQESSPQPKKTQTMSVTSPAVPHFAPSMFAPQPPINPLLLNPMLLNPMLFNPLFLQMISANLPPSLISPFPFGFPWSSPVPSPNPPMTHNKEDEVKEQEDDVEPEVSVD